MSTYPQLLKETVAAARSLSGWTAVRKKDGYLITNPTGQTTTLHNTPPSGRGVPNLRSQLKRMGMDVALKEAETLKTARAKGNLLADRAKGEAALERAAQQLAGMAVQTADGETLRAKDLTTPQSVRRVYQDVLVTPELALEILAINGRNRPQRPQTWGPYRDMMLDGRWLETHQGIAIDSNGDVQDGQHRLRAVMESGVTLRFDITVGADPRAFAVIDTGRGRTARDVFAVDGRPHAGHVVSAWRALWAFENAREVVSWSSLRIHNDVLLAFANEHPLIGDNLDQAHQAYAKPIRATGLIPAAGYAFLALAWTGLGVEHPLLGEYVEGWLSGEGMRTMDPRLALFRYGANSTKQSRDVRTVRGHLGVLLRTWQNFAQGEQVKLIVWRPKDAVPNLFMPRS